MAQDTHKQLTGHKRNAINIELAELWKMSRPQGREGRRPVGKFVSQMRQLRQSEGAQLCELCANLQSDKKKLLGCLALTLSSSSQNNCSATMMLQTHIPTPRDL